MISHPHRNAGSFIDIGDYNTKNIPIRSFFISSFVLNFISNFILSPVLSFASNFIKYFILSFASNFVTYFISSRYKYCSGYNFKNKISRRDIIFTLGYGAGKAHFYGQSQIRRGDRRICDPCDAIAENSF